MIQAERVLLEHALKDPLNERFVFLSDRLLFKLRRKIFWTSDSKKSRYFYVLVGSKWTIIGVCAPLENSVIYQPCNMFVSENAS